MSSLRYPNTPAAPRLSTPVERRAFAPVSTRRDVSPVAN
jgi:hypothetical protein